MGGRLWQTWKRFAHRAAEIQSLAILAALYWIVVVPIGLVRRRKRNNGPPHWTTRSAGGTVSIEDARRQS